MKNATRLELLRRCCGSSRSVCRWPTASRSSDEPDCSRLPDRGHVLGNGAGNAAIQPSIDGSQGERMLQRSRPLVPALALLFISLLHTTASAQDVVQVTNGDRITGTV